MVGIYQDDLRAEQVTLLADSSDTEYVRLKIQVDATGEVYDLVGDRQYPAYWGWSIKWFENKEEI